MNNNHRIWGFEMVKETKPTVSVVMCARNAERYIGSCIESILNQGFKDFEIIVVDDASTDRTGDLIRGVDDQRIRYYRNEEWLGVAKSRNTGLMYAAGKYIFFTDADCVVAKNWIAEGLKYLEDADCVGVEGKVLYVSEHYKPTFSDHVMKSRNGGSFMTGNVAYEKSAVRSVGGFDERMSYFSDRDFALRIMKQGEICFNKDMIVYHPRVTMTPERLIKSAAFVENRVYLFKRFGEKNQISWRVVNPFNLAKILFPPLIFVSLFFNKFETENDFKLLPYTYVYVVFERLHIWKTCARERVFLI
jgi:glycosyltransferase involved in cell wall biosynthesis